MKKLCLWLPGRRTYNFWNSAFLIFSTYKQLLSKSFWKNFKVSNKILKVLMKLYWWSLTNIYDLKFSAMKQRPFEFFWSFHGRAFCFLNFVKWGKLKPQFCWYFWNVLLWVILMEMKVSQVGCFQITGRWICYSIFFDISFILFFTRLLSKGLWRNYPFWTQIPKTPFQYVAYYRKLECLALNIR